MLPPIIPIIATKDIDPVLKTRFIESPVAAFDEYSDFAKCVFLVRQSFLLNYLNRLYDNEPLLLIKQYREYIALQLKTIQFTANNELDVAVKEKYLDSVNICKSLLGIEPSILLDTDTLMSYLSSQHDMLEDNTGVIRPIPSAGPLSFCISYLYFMNKVDTIEYLKNENTYAERDNFILENAILPIVSLTHTAIEFDFSLVQKFNFRPEVINKTHDAPGFHKSVFAWFLCFEWNGVRFSDLMAFLASHTMEFNTINTKDKTNNALFLFLYINLFNWENTANDPSSYTVKSDFSEIFIKNFLILLRLHYGIKFDVPKLLSQILSCYTQQGDEESKKIIEYFNTINVSDDAPISNEAYNAFKRSMFGSFDELDFNSESFSLYSAQNEDDKDDSSDADDPGNDSDDELDDLEEPEEPADTGADKEGDDDDQGDEESNSDDDDNKSDEEDDEDDEDEDKPPVNDSPTNDKGRGSFEIKLSEGEDLDSILFRHEVNSQISDILKNPGRIPSNSLVLLRKVRTYWINLLSIQTLKNILKYVKKFKFKHVKKR